MVHTYTKIFFLVFFAASLSACRETFEKYYPSYSDVISDKAIERGWIPSWLPENAVNIHEIHNLDTNKSMLTFRFKGEHPIDFNKDCEEIKPTLLKAHPFNVSWWPKDISDRELRSNQYQFYSCENKEALLAISIKQGEAFYWRP
ncbi:MAG: hypothetical protein GX087_01950 [Desulfobulbaceae bacterium]|nr:hypothetical protein [Desulfobulbaceae bacterium]